MRGVFYYTSFIKYLPGVVYKYCGFFTKLKLKERKRTQVWFKWHPLNPTESKGGGFHFKKGKGILIKAEVEKQKIMLERKLTFKKKCLKNVDCDKWNPACIGPIFILNYLWFIFETFISNYFESLSSNREKNFGLSFIRFLIFLLIQFHTYS